MEGRWAVLSSVVVGGKELGRQREREMRLVEREGERETEDWGVVVVVPLGWWALSSGTVSGKIYEFHPSRGGGEMRI